ncbi:MAG: NmrA/HSCARG family protein [Halieaceae bacterium]|nr:NmrA/HSCARG family protein [Halieaceae bacterium]
MFRLFKLILLLCLLAACNNTEDTAQTKSQRAGEQSGKLVLVTGVTGRQGGAVARALMENGVRVRGMTRNPSSDRAAAMASLGVQLIQGDFDDSTSLDTAMNSVSGVFLVTNFWEHDYDGEVRHGRNVVDAANRADVAHLVFTSVANADQQTGIPHFDSKYEIERYIHEAGVPYTILRPVSFMENWEYQREKIAAGKISSPFSESTRLQQISVRDIGRFAALAFSNPESWLGRSLDIAADEYTVKEVVDVFSQVTGNLVAFEKLPWDTYQKVAGEEMTIMDRWIDGTGYSADIKLVRSYLPDMMSLEEYLRQNSW